MSLEYAVDRLYEIGWLPEAGLELEKLSDGRRYPTVGAVARFFEERELRLSIKGNARFRCCQATWGPAAEEPDPNRTADDHHGTVVGSCDREAAVYALAKFLTAQAESQLATA